MKITWLGHACFKIEKAGFVLIIDPYQDGSVPGLLPIREKADLVLCSHEHRDHNGRELVELRKGTENPFTIETIDTWHDEVQGAKRGATRMFVIDDGEARIAHLGDLGCEPEPEQLKKLAGLDVALIPVGGHYTIDGREAAELLAKLRPRIAIPMHYRDDEAGFGYDVIGTAADFTRYFDRVEMASGSEIETGDTFTAPVVVLRPARR